MAEIKDVISFLEWFEIEMKNLGGYAEWLKKYPNASSANVGYLEYCKKGMK
jgi:hypothetical protein